MPSSDTSPGRDDGQSFPGGRSGYDALRGRRVLLVDDNVFNRRLAIELLEDVGVRVTAVENGRQALDALQARAFDLVLMDCRMPVMDGYEATRAIRAEPAWRGLPVIAMTASILPEEHQAARAAGMDDELIKPIDTTRLYQTLLRWTDHRVGGPADADSGRTTSLDELPGIDSAVGMARAMNNPVMFERLLRLFVRMHGNFGSAFAQASGPNARLDRRRLAHDLKSSAATLGAFALQRVAQELERACAEGDDAGTVDDRLAGVLRELGPVLAGIQALPVARR
ncbi:MAG: response regulator [Burkholderiaceae bacterium]